MKRREFMTLLGGSAMTWPLAARAQQLMPTIGLLTPSNLPDWAVSGIRKGLDETGYAEGRNLVVLHRSAEGQFDRLPGLAGELVSRQVSVILATGSPVPARTAK